VPLKGSSEQLCRSNLMQQLHRTACLFLLQLLQASNVNQGVLACKSIPENIFA
jgi:hypothetical protein